MLLNMTNISPRFSRFIGSFKAQTYPDIFNPQLNLIKVFPSTRSVLKSNSPVHTQPLESRFTLVLGAVETNMICCCGCAAMLIYCSVRDWTGICYVIGLEISRNHPITRYRIRWGFSFSTLMSGFKNIRIRRQIRWMRVDVDGSRVRKETVGDSISGYMWTVPKMVRKTSILT